MQNQLNQKQQFLSIAVKKSIIPDPAQSFRQHMLHDQMQEIFPFKGSISRIAALAFNIFKRDPAVLIGNDIFFADNTTV